MSESEKGNIYDFHGNVIGGPYRRVSHCNNSNCMTAINIDNSTSLLLDYHANITYSVSNYELTAISDDLLIRREGINQCDTVSDLFRVSAHTSFRKCSIYWHHSIGLFYESMDGLLYYIDNIDGNKDYLLHDGKFGSTIRSFQDSNVICYGTAGNECVAFDLTTKESRQKLPNGFSFRYISQKYCIIDLIDIEKYMIYTIADDGRLDDVFGSVLFEEAFYAKNLFICVREKSILFYSDRFELHRKLSTATWKIVHVGFETIQLYHKKLKRFFLFELPRFSQICNSSSVFHAMLRGNDSYYLGIMGNADISFQRNDGLDV